MNIEIMLFLGSIGSVAASILLVVARIVVREKSEKIAGRLFLSALIFFVCACVLGIIWAERQGPFTITLAVILVIGLLVMYAGNSMERPDLFGLGLCLVICIVVCFAIYMDYYYTYCCR